MFTRPGHNKTCAMMHKSINFFNPAPIVELSEPRVPKVCAGTVSKPVPVHAILLVDLAEEQRKRRMHGARQNTQVIILAR